jgi:hypothetical protein
LLARRSQRRGARRGVAPWSGGRGLGVAAWRVDRRRKKGEGKDGGKEKGEKRKIKGNKKKENKKRKIEKRFRN